MWRDWLLKKVNILPPMKSPERMDTDEVFLPLPTTNPPVGVNPTVGTQPLLTTGKMLAIPQRIEHQEEEMKVISPRRAKRLTTEQLELFYTVVNHSDSIKAQAHLQLQAAIRNSTGNDTLVMQYVRDEAEDPMSLDLPPPRGNRVPPSVKTQQYHNNVLYGDYDFIKERASPLMAPLWNERKPSATVNVVDGVVQEGSARATAPLDLCVKTPDCAFELEHAFQLADEGKSMEALEAIVAPPIEKKYVNFAKEGNTKKRGTDFWRGVQTLMDEEVEAGPLLKQRRRRSLHDMESFGAFDTRKPHAVPWISEENIRRRLGVSPAYLDEAKQDFRRWGELYEAARTEEERRAREEEQSWWQATEAEGELKRMEFALALARQRKA